MSEKFYCLIDHKYLLSNDGEFLMEVKEIDFSYFFQNKNYDEKMNKLIWERDDTKTAIQFLESYFDCFDNYFNLTIDFITIEGMKKRNNTLDHKYNVYFVVLRDKNDDLFLVNNTFTKTFKLEYDKEIFKNISKLSADKNNLLDSNEIKNYCNFNYKEKLDQPYDSEYIHHLIRTSSKLYNTDWNYILKYFVNKLEQSNFNMDNYNELIICYSNRCGIADSYLWFLPKIFEIFLKEKSVNINCISYHTNQILGLQLNIDTLKKISNFYYERFSNNPYECIPKFDISKSIKENNEILKLYNSAFKTLIHLIFPEQLNYSGYFIRYLFFKSYNLLYDVAKYDGDYLTLNDSIFVQDNFYTRKVIKPLILQLYKELLKSNFQSIVNKFVRIYYKSPTDVKFMHCKGETRFIGKLYTTIICDYVYRTRMKKGIDLNKRYGLTYNNITTLAIELDI